jgi:hypothetical protein
MAVTSRSRVDVPLIEHPEPRGHVGDDADLPLPENY